MIKFENTEVMGWEHAIRGMRNPLNSWDKSDSFQCDAEHCCMCKHKFNDGSGRCAYSNDEDGFILGEKDIDLMKRLRNAGTDHRKYLRMITVYVDITAPLYFWKEWSTYKVGTVANSCSTMHTIHKKEFTIDDFSHEHLNDGSLDLLYDVIGILNINREYFLEEPNKDYWWQMIQLLPSSYNQKRTVMLNYEVLNNMYKSRKNHKLDEWSVGFVDWIKTLPYAEELIVGGE